MIFYYVCQIALIHHKWQSLSKKWKPVDHVQADRRRLFSKEKRTGSGKEKIWGGTSEKSWGFPKVLWSIRLGVFLVCGFFCWCFKVCKNFKPKMLSVIKKWQMRYEDKWWKSFKKSGAERLRLIKDFFRLFAEKEAGLVSSMEKEKMVVEEERRKVNRIFLICLNLKFECIMLTKRGGGVDE